MLKDFWLASCFVTAILATGCNDDAPGLIAKQETNLDAGQQIAYVEELKHVNVVTRFSHTSRGFVEAPANFLDSVDAEPIQLPNLIRVNFTDNSVIGHADFEAPVRCLLLEINEENRNYGVYGLWKQKADLEMPLPTHESTITWDGVSSEAALIRVISEIGLSQERSREIVDDHKDYWFAPGLRAFLVTKVPVNESLLPTIYYFEKVSND